jgi:hypothetical protein
VKRIKIRSYKDTAVKRVSGTTAAVPSFRPLEFCSIALHSQGNAAECAISLRRVWLHVRTADGCERISVKWGSFGNNNFATVRTVRIRTHLEYNSLHNARGEALPAVLL